MQLNEKYEVIKQLGQGGSSVVYLVKDRKLGILRAAKLIQRPLERKTGEASVQLSDEIFLLKKLNHPSIPRIVEVFEEEGASTCVVMDYIDGITLRQYVCRFGGMDEMQVQRVALQACQVLMFLQEQEPPVIYGDLKPDNVILKWDGTISLVDFGTSSSSMGGKARSRWTGTNGFAAPELYRRSTALDMRADIFSLGATLYYLLAGQKAEGKTRQDRKMLRQRASSPMQKIVFRCMDRRAEGRYPDARHVFHDLYLLPLHKRRRRRIFFALVPSAALAAVFSGLHAGGWSGLVRARILPLVCQCLDGLF